jgi:hypothetical protein
MRVINALALATLLLVTAGGASLAQDKSAAATTSVAVGSQYDTAHVYIAPADLDRFSDSLVATFGGTKSQQAALTITPTPSTTMWQAVFTPVGTFSVFGFTTPIPYPFGLERTGYLVTDMDKAIQSAKANEADVVVAPFKDPIGRDVIVQWTITRQLSFALEAVYFRVSDVIERAGGQNSRYLGVELAYGW